MHEAGYRTLLQVSTPWRLQAVRYILRSILVMKVYHFPAAYPPNPKWETVISSQLTSSRRRPCHFLGISGMHYSRHPTDLRRRPVVLGIAADQVDGKRCIRQRCCCGEPESHHPCGDYHSVRDVGSRHSSLHGSTKVLSSGARQGALLLHVSSPPEDYLGKLTS